eukprot:TRINITY_DN9816_c0_g1_i1.p1 TRINITY_DN9816_c0_g1~~TRINITY_DN9816_c0_g1_i1.p1  ORF type:complete len:134 (-),score=20.92 TRINITY_DN9816_c0_g1_i1:656-1057(-)
MDNIYIKEKAPVLEQPFSNRIRTKLLEMTKRAAQRSNMARAKIREQLSLLKQTKPLPEAHSASCQVLPSRSLQGKSKAKMHYDTSLVDLIDSIENEHSKNTTTRQSIELLRSTKRNTKVYYPRHQLLKTIQQE